MVGVKLPAEKQFVLSHVSLKNPLRTWQIIFKLLFLVSQLVALQTILNTPPFKFLLQLGHECLILLSPRIIKLIK